LGNASSGDDHGFAPAGHSQRAVRRDWPTVVVGRRDRVAVLAFMLLAIAHLAALYWPRVEIEGPVAWTDKVAHVLLFALPTLAGLLAGVRPAYVIAAFALHAPVSELAQHFLLPHRSGDAWDAVADAAGVVLGVTAFVVWRARRRW
jgi:VanZ family protein